MPVDRDPLLHPTRLFTRAELLQRPSPAPAAAGVYAWYFRDLPPGIPAVGCHTHQEHTLLYVGIAPARAAAEESTTRPQTLRKRLRIHLRGDASRSTLRLSLGVLLADTLSLTLRPTGRTARLTFAQDEATLSAWMDAHARVCWLEDPAPWTTEQQLIDSLNLPLNLSGNSQHPFHATLSAARGSARSDGRARLTITAEPRH